MQNIKEGVAQVANTVTVGGFGVTLIELDTYISIAVGITALITGLYSIVWYRVKLKQTRMENEQSKRNDS